MGTKGKSTSQKQGKTSKQSKTHSTDTTTASVQEEPMKIGMVFECGPDGADKKVCEYLLRKLKPDVRIDSITLGNNENKSNLMNDCGKLALQLFQRGCHHVAIIWDLYPAWRDDGKKPSRDEDRAKILTALADSNVDISKVHLICIQEELEAWLIADGRAISAVLSTPEHQVKISDAKSPELRGNPKKYLTQIFKENRGRRYVDVTDAEKIIKELPDFRKIKKCCSFVRFAKRVAGVDL